jgi:hypothetical protein
MPTSMNVDVDGDGSPDFLLELIQTSTSRGGYPEIVDFHFELSFSAYGSSSNTVVMGSSDWVRACDAGDSIGPTLSTGFHSTAGRRRLLTATDTWNMTTGQPWGYEEAGPWTGGLINGYYLGFSFSNSSGLHYGWALIKADSLGWTGNLKALAWEVVPDAPILVADEIGVPPPEVDPVPVLGPAGLGILGTVLGLSALRRLRA